MPNYYQTEEISKKVKLMKLVLLLAGVTIAGKKERLITDETKCCERVKVRIEYT